MVLPLSISRVGDPRPHHEGAVDRLAEHDLVQGGGIEGPYAADMPEPAPNPSGHESFGHVLRASNRN